MPSTCGRTSDEVTASVRPVSSAVIVTGWVASVTTPTSGGAGGGALGLLAHPTRVSAMVKRLAVARRENIIRPAHRGKSRTRIGIFWYMRGRDKARRVFLPI